MLSSSKNQSELPFAGSIYTKHYGDDSEIVLTQQMKTLNPATHPPAVSSCVDVEVVGDVDAPA